MKPFVYTTDDAAYDPLRHVNGHVPEPVVIIAEEPETIGSGDIVEIDNCPVHFQVEMVVTSLDGTAMAFLTYGPGIPTCWPVSLLRLVRRGG